MALCAACTADPPVITEPTIWIEPSATIDPTALPLHDQAYVALTPQLGSVFVCDVKMFMKSNGPGAANDGPWVHTAEVASNGLPLGVPTGTFP